MTKYIYRYFEFEAGADEYEIAKALDQLGAVGWLCIQIFKEHDDFSGVRYRALLTKALDEDTSSTINIGRTHDWAPQENADQCATCPNRNIPNGYIGDWPCDWCKHNRSKITYNDSSK